MAHFAEIKDGRVQRVIVIHNNELLINGLEVESKGAEFCANLFGGTWIQTSYNHRIRKQYAGINYSYDADLDIFIAPQPYPSWVLDENHDWQPPSPKPDGDFVWDEENLAWVPIPGI